MRYIILNNKVSQDEISQRQLYVNSIFNVYTIPYCRDRYVELVSVPASALNVIMIVGHNVSVFKFLKNNPIIEKIIILVTCNTVIPKYLYNDKIIFTAKKEDGLADTYDGSYWNFKFDITNSELDLYLNSKLDLLSNLAKSFERE